MTMKKISIILAALCCCISMKAQNVGDEFENSKGRYRITSTNPNTVTLVKAQTISKGQPTL